MRRCGLKLVPVNAPNVEYEVPSIHIIDKWHLLSRLSLATPPSDRRLAAIQGRRSTQIWARQE